MLCGHFDQKSLMVFNFYTKIDLKCTWNPQHWYLNVCINQQIIAIVLEFICALICITNEVLKNSIDFICLTKQPVRNMGTKNIRNNPSKYILRTYNIEKQSGAYI